MSESRVITPPIPSQDEIAVVRNHLKLPGETTPDVKIKDALTAASVLRMRVAMEAGARRNGVLWKLGRATVPVALLLFIAAIWAGDWRYAGTAAVVLVGGFIALAVVAQHLKARGVLGMDKKP